MKVVLLGAGGQLARDLVNVLADSNLVALTHADADVTDFPRVRDIVGDVNPDIVINSAAYHRTDECEEYPEKAFHVNAHAVRNLAQICTHQHCALLHVSTDYVFGGERRTPYREDDAPGPLSVYGVSKLAGEYLARTACPRLFIVRSSGLYGVAGASGKGGNFVETMIRMAREGKTIRVVDDQVLTPTYTRDLAVKIRELISTDGYGLYHVTNSGQCSWHEFAERIFALLDLRPDFGPTSTEAFGSKAQRPAFSVLAQERLKQSGLGVLRPWPEALRAYLCEKGHLTS